MEINNTSSAISELVARGRQAMAARFPRSRDRRIPVSNTAAPEMTPPKHVT